MLLTLIFMIHGNLIYDLTFTENSRAKVWVLTWHLDYPLFSSCILPMWEIFVLSTQQMSVEMLKPYIQNLYFLCSEKTKKSQKDSLDYRLWNRVQCSCFIVSVNILYTMCIIIIKYIYSVFSPPKDVKGILKSHVFFVRPLSDCSYAEVYLMIILLFMIILPTSTLASRVYQHEHVCRVKHFMLRPPCPHIPKGFFVRIGLLWFCGMSLA